MPRWRSINNRVRRLKAWDQSFWAGPPLTYHVGYDAPRNSEIDFETEAGDLTLNPQVAATLRWFHDSARDAWLEVRQVKADSTEEATTDHDAIRLIDSPNPIYDGAALWKATERDFLAGKQGCAYWRVLANADGVPVQIWHLPERCVRPVWYPGSDKWVDHYTYSAGGQTIRLMPEEVIVFRDGVDTITRGGIPRLRPALAMVAALNEVPVYLYLLLKKLGMPGLVIAPTNGAIPDKDEMDKIRTTIDERTTGDNRFRSTGVPFEVKIDTVGRSPEEMRIDRLPIIPESILAALLGVNAMVSGLPSGAESKTYANLQEAVQDAWKTVRTVQKTFASVLTKELLPRFGEPGGAYFGWNYTEVAALKEAADSVSRRTLDEFDADVITLNQALTKLGYDTVEDELGEMRKTELVSHLGGNQAKELLNGGGLPAPEGDQQDEEGADDEGADQDGEDLEEEEVDDAA